VATRLREDLSAVERKAIAKIRTWRAAPEDAVNAQLLASPAQVMQNLILDSNGNAKLRFESIAAELGVAMRTLERTFVAEYEKTMAAFQLETRLSAAQHLLEIMYPGKISVIADLLGYDAERGFSRFFQKYMHESPARWAKRRKKEAQQKAGRLRARTENPHSE
jgi:transcriptional regulator GlxA family with amidase domain